MIFKATFVREVGNSAVSQNYLFLLHDSDLELLGVASPRDWDKKHVIAKIPRRLSETKQQELHNIQNKGFVITLPYKPDAWENAEAFPGQLTTMRKGETYWILLRPPFKTNNTFKYRDSGVSISLSHFDALGIYPDIRDEQGVLESLELLEQMPVANYRQSAIQHHEKQFFKMFRECGAGGIDATGKGKLDWWFRVWGCTVGFFLSSNLLNLGKSKYGKINIHQPTDASYSDFYKLFAKTSPIQSGDEKWVNQVPLGHVLTDLSDPSEFGAYGCLLPIAMILHPYAFVGPCSNRGISGEGLSKLFPFWLIDILASSLYTSDYTDERRTQAIVVEAIKHLEARNHQAFYKYAGVHPKWNESFAFDKDGIIPKGSTMFSPTVIYNAVVTRKNELELIRKGLLTQTYIFNQDYPNPYNSLAGLLGKPLEAVPLSDSNKVMKTISSVCSVCPYVDEHGKVRKWLGLQYRVSAAKDIVDLIFSRDMEPSYQSPLPVNMPITEKDVNNPHQKILSPSQADASLNIIRWRISCVTGGAGTGKSYFLYEPARFVQELRASGDDMYFMVLSQNNVAVRRVYKLFENEREAYMLGDLMKDKKVGDDLPDFQILTGTIDSFLGMIKSNAKFRKAVRTKECILAIDECGQVSPEKFREIINIFRDLNNTNTLSSKLRRLVFLGDPFQLLPVEPGCLFGDLLEVIPTVHLVEQQRFTKTDAQVIEQQVSLEKMFDDVRKGMHDSLSRIEVVSNLVNVSKSADNSPNLKVYLIDDIPADPPSEHDDEEFWSKFVCETEKKVQNLVFSEILEWNNLQLSDGVTPKIRNKPLQEERQRALKDYMKFEQAVNKPVLPYRIVTLTKDSRSESGLTDYISASSRVNGWFHDALLGRLPEKPGYQSYTNIIKRTSYIGDTKLKLNAEDTPVEYSKYIDDLRSQPFELWKFLSRNRPRAITLRQGWPYTVTKGNFKNQGVYRDDIIWYKQSSVEGGENTYIFTKQDGGEFKLPVRYCNFNYLNYGWAANVHKMQGNESPLIFLIWMDGICPKFIQNYWDKLRVVKEDDVCKPFDEFTIRGQVFGSELSSLDDKLDVQAFYTALTRTSIVKRKMSQMNLYANSNSDDTIGKCVLIAGKHTLRRLLSLKVYKRVTPFSGMVCHKMAMNAEKV